MLLEIPLLTPRVKHWSRSLAASVSPDLIESVRHERIYSLIEESGVVMPRSDLESLVYVSSAVRLLSIDEIEGLLKRARERNKEYGITGVLLHSNGNFVQYLEGSKDNLDTIYRIIQEDARHTGLILISREAIESRQFGDWSMGFLSKDGDDYSPSERQLVETILELPGDNPNTAQIVLKGFWERGGSQ